MADVYAVFGTLLALGIAFPGLLTGTWLVFPGAVGRARQRVAAAPWRSFFLGLGGLVATVIVVAILNAMPFGLAKFLGILIAFGAFGVATLGASGLAVEMGERLRDQAAPTISRAGAVVRGAVALELAAIFPIVGWFLVIPGVLLVGFGAAIFALIRRLPAVRSTTIPESATAGA